ncbi:1316_t:CDS:1, partial [Dentiscutata erythropus]
KQVRKRRRKEIKEKEKFSGDVMDIYNKSNEEKSKKEIDEETTNSLK